MTGTFYGIQIGMSGLIASQVGEDVTGQNIANAETAGYASESIDFQEVAPASPTSYGQNGAASSLGGGVVAGAVTQASNQFLNTQLNNATSANSQQSYLETSLNQAQSVFNEPSTNGLGTAITTFFDGFDTLANDPDDEGVQESTIQNGVALASDYQSIQGQLTQQATALTNQASTDMSTVNQLGSQIASLNSSIQVGIASGQEPNSEIDSRNALLTQLSGLANITVQNNADGTVNVAIGTSDLVVGVNSNTLSLTGANSLTARGDLTSGELAGVVQSQASLASYQSSLDNLAAATISDVNAVQESGSGTDGSTGVPFFTGTNASTIAVNQALVNDPNQLASAAQTTGGALPPSGDNTNALALANVQNQVATSGPLTGQTISGYYQSLVTTIGSQTAAATTASTTASATLGQATQQLDTATGVSTDAQMVDMLNYQRSYEASAEVVKTMDDMLSTLIDNMIPS